MTAAHHKKFLFDTDFSPDAATADPVKAGVQVEPEAEAIVEAPPEEIAPTFSEEDLARAREEGYSAGHTEATKDLTTALEQRLVNTMDAIDSQIANLFDAFERDKEEHSRDAVAVATVIVRKLFPALNMDTAMAEIEHMIVEAMKRTSGAPTLIIRVSEDMKEAVEAKAHTLAVSHGREGTMSIMVDAKLAPGDAAVEWDGGGMVRDNAMVWNKIDEIIERNLGKLNHEVDTDDESTNDGDTDERSEQEQGQPDALDTSLEVVNDAPVKDNEELAAESHAEPFDAPVDVPVNTPEDIPVEETPLGEDDTPEAPETSG